MHLVLKHIKLHGFLSFGDAELDLQDRGYCSIEGVNKNPKDVAISNGSGKSSIVSAICWALTGETIQGLKSNIANIYLNDGCFVQLDFDIDNIPYSITRYKDYEKIGTNLKVVINGEDKSGKGIRESEEILKQYLPDITRDLIGSVIILGQGLPCKFSSNSPSGRKEVLEKLSKSDFMIEDIKNRITTRQDELTKEVRVIEDSLLQNNTLLSTYNSQLDIKTKAKNDWDSPDYDEGIKRVDNELLDVQTKLDTLEKQKVSLDETSKLASDNYLKVFKDKQLQLDTLTQAYNEKHNGLISEQSTYKAKIESLEREIIKLKSIKDVCPTCGQKIPGATKPDTSSQEKELEDLKSVCSKTAQQIVLCDCRFEEYKKQLEELYGEQLEKLHKEKEDSASISMKCANDIRELNTKLISLKEKRSNLVNEKNSCVDKFNQLVKDIEDLTNTIKELQDKNKKLDEDNINLKAHLDVINKMNTYVKRDFRGFLLQHIIKFIDARAKEYCQDVFGTKELVFELDGNNINISYCGKDFENLSGGEKQKVDLILQFSIRDMMCQYLNFSSNCLFLDEIFDGMDAIGCDNILNLISRKLMDVGSIFIISHRGGSLGIPSDDSIVIEKDSSGISRIKEGR